MVAIFHIPETLEECTIELNGCKLPTSEAERSGAGESVRNSSGVWAARRSTARPISATYHPKCLFPIFDSSGHCIQRRKRVNITIGKGFTDVILTKCVFWVFHTFSIYSLSWCYFLLKLHVWGLILFAKVLATSI